MAKQTKAQLEAEVSRLKKEVVSLNKALEAKTKLINEQGGAYRFRFHADDLADHYYCHLVDSTVLVRETKLFDADYDENIYRIMQVRRFSDGNRVDIIRKVHRVHKTVTTEAYFYDRLGDF